MQVIDTTRADVDPNATPARVQARSDSGEFKAPAFVRLAGTGAQWLESGPRSQAGGASAPRRRLLFYPSHAAEPLASVITPLAIRAK